LKNLPTGGDEWLPRIPDVRRCPHCKSYYFDRPKKMLKVRKNKENK